MRKYSVSIVMRMQLLFRLPAWTVFVLLLNLASVQATPIDNNLQVVDLTDLAGDLPLNATSTMQILLRTQDWEH